MDAPHRQHWLPPDVVVAIEVAIAVDRRSLALHTRVVHEKNAAASSPAEWSDCIPS